MECKDEMTLTDKLKNCLMASGSVGIVKLLPDEPFPKF